MDAWAAVTVVLAVVAWQNLLQTTPARWRDVGVSVGVLLAAGVGAWWLLTRVDPTVGLLAAVPWTLGAFAVTATVVAIASGRPRTARWLADRRIGAMSARTFWVHVLLRIPVLTALVEEVLFRGVAWAALDEVGGTPAAWLGSAVAFGFGHVAVAHAQARREGRPVLAWIAVTVVATTMAGLALGALRWSTGGIWAPAGVHAVVNATLAWGAHRVAADQSDTV